MGLDMYLSKKTYVKQWEHQTPENRYSVSVKKGGKTCKGIKSRRISKKFEIKSRVAITK